MHGWLVIDKPVGPGSTQIVSAVKRALRDGGYPKVKVGHGGTLDPLASGVLPVALGEATKLSGRLLDAQKVYAFTISFGSETDTLDAEGVVVATSPNRPTWTEVEARLPFFLGESDQVPPRYSAVKIAGKPAYARARAGEAVEMPSRRVTIHELKPWSNSLFSAKETGEGANLPTGTGLECATLYARVSKGTYIRALARDISTALGTVGHVTHLRRLKAGPFRLESGISLDKLHELAMARDLEQALLPLTAGLDDIPALSVNPDQARLLRQGRELVGIAVHPGLHLAIDRSVPVALVEARSDGKLRVVRGFNL